MVHSEIHGVSRWARERLIVGEVISLDNLALFIYCVLMLAAEGAYGNIGEVLYGFIGRTNEKPLETSSSSNSLMMEVFSKVDLWFPRAREKDKSFSLSSPLISHSGKESPSNKVLEVKFQRGCCWRRGFKRS